MSYTAKEQFRLSSMSSSHLSFIHWSMAFLTFSGFLFRPPLSSMLLSFINFELTGVNFNLLQYMILILLEHFEKTEKAKKQRSTASVFIWFLVSSSLVFRHQRHKANTRLMETKSNMIRLQVTKRYWIMSDITKYIKRSEQKCRYINHHYKFISIHKGGLNWGFHISRYFFIFTYLIKRRTQDLRQDNRYIYIYIFLENILKMRQFHIHVLG